ncbi:MAG: type II toxin-antitoxin system RelE/ParE family toxin [Patescibacteria group bacterium]|jgi:phage-related protein
MKIKFFSREIEEFIIRLEKPTIAKVLRSFDLLEKFGNQIGMPHSKALSDGLFELRIRGVQEVRFLYFFKKTEMIVILSGFLKKTNSMPVREMRLAKQRKKELDAI